METGGNQAAPAHEVEATVEVRVKGEAWTRARSLLDAGPDDPLFVVNPECGSITFGDGVNGRRPPVGVGNIIVSYRYGDGSSGNIAKRIDDDGELTGFWVDVGCGRQAVGWRKPRP
jgi:hypothetical protein